MNFLIFRWKNFQKIIMKRSNNLKDKLRKMDNFYVKSKD